MQNIYTKFDSLEFSVPEKYLMKKMCLWKNNTNVDKYIYATIKRERQIVSLTVGHYRLLHCQSKLADRPMLINALLSIQLLPVYNT